MTDPRNAGDTPLTFAAALHSYLSVRDAAAARVHGLDGATGEDNADGGAPVRLPPGPFAAHGLGDMPEDGASSFVCLEPASLSPQPLPPDETWRGQVRYRAALVPAGSVAREAP